MTKPNIPKQQKGILEEIHSKANFLAMFDALEGISFFAKDRNFCLIYANPPFHQRLGLKSQKELLGKNDFELFPEPLAKKFRKDDEWIVRESKPMTGLVELFPNLQGIPAEDVNAPSIKLLAGANGQMHVSSKINAWGSRTRPRFGCADPLRGYLCLHPHPDR